MLIVPYMIVKLFVLSMILFLAAVKAREMKEAGRLTWFWAAVAYPVAGVFIVLDAVFLNGLIGTALYLELPQLRAGEWMFSGRTQRHYDKGSRMARWWALQIDMVAPGHIHLHPEDQR